jgi:large subunit ribosomal protein L1
MEEKISEAIKAALEAAPERKFIESVDISFTIKDVDLKNPTNRIKEEIRLPSGRGRELKIAMFAAGEAAAKAKSAGIAVFTPQDIEDFGGKKGRAKKVANEFDFFLSEVPHMGLIGRTLVSSWVLVERCLAQSPPLLTLLPWPLDLPAPWSSSRAIR